MEDVNANEVDDMKMNEPVADDPQERPEQSDDVKELKTMQSRMMEELAKINDQLKDHGATQEVSGSSDEYFRSFLPGKKGETNGGKE